MEPRRRPGRRTIVQKPDDANQTSTLTIPIVVPSNSVANKGCQLKSVEIDFEITGAAWMP